MIKNFSILVFSIILTSCAVAQPSKKTTKESPADKYAEEAYLELMKPNGDFNKALELCNKGVKKDSTSPKIWEYKANIEYDMGKYSDALKSINKLMTLEPDINKHYYSLGKTQLKLFLFDEAKKSFETYLNSTAKRPSDSEKDAKKLLANMDVMKKLVNQKVDFKPINLGPNINSKYPEYWPGLTLDGKFFYFTRQTPKGPRMTEDFFRSEIIDSLWQPSTKLPFPVNTEDNEGCVSITADGKNIFFSAKDRFHPNGVPIGLGGHDIYFCRYDNGKWSNPINLGQPINSSSWDSQPSISPDGLTLYFSSDRPGGFGKSDIYKSEFKDGRFQPPVNLGPEINTSGEDEAPFIHFDNQTLYFTSNGHPGLGSSDIFISQKDENGKFSPAVNLGYPINSERMELGMIVDRLGQFGYISSSREGGFGDLDIYKFELPSTLKPLPVSYVKGTVYDFVSKDKIVAKIELTDLSTGKIVANIESQKETGEFFIVLKSNKKYMLTVDQTNYLFYSDHFSLKQHDKLEPYVIEIPLKKPDKNTEIVLNNVFFDTDKFELKEESKLELDKLVLMLKKFPFMKIEIGGHTDNTGDANKNKTLSQNRAKAVRDYLVSKGVETTRLQFVGYGDTQPIEDNKTPEGRAKNRRTVFKVLSVQ